MNVNELKWIVLLVCVDFPFSFGMQHIFGCLLNAPDVLTIVLGCVLTIIVNLCLTMFKSF